MHMSAAVFITRFEQSTVGTGVRQRTVAPLRIIADFVLGKTGDRNVVALARETVAAARL
jgi:hypothetical protein